MYNKNTCDMDCFNCKFDDCKNEQTYSERSRYKYRSEEYKQKDRELKKRKYYKAKEEGLCVVCQKKPQKHGTKCYECWIRQQRFDQKKNLGIREYRKNNNLCYFCGGEPLADKKVCEKHYKIYAENAKKCNMHPNTIERRKEILDSIFAV